MFLKRKQPAQGSMSMKSQVAGTMLLTIGQKPISYIRSAVCAALFGITRQTDAFYMAISIISLVDRIPNTLRAAIIPIRTRETAEGGKEQADAYTNTLLNMIILASIAAAVFIFVCAPLLLDIFAPGFSEETRNITILMLRILSPIAVTSAVTAVLVAVLNYHKQFYSSAVGAAVSNVVWLIVPLLLWRYIGIYAMIAGYMAGLAMQVVMLCFLLRGRFRYKFLLNYKSPAIKKTFKMAVPIIIGSCASIICQMVDKALASGLPEGSVSALSYAHLFVGLVSAMVMEPVSTVMYPTLSRLVSENKTDDIKDMVMRVISTLTIILLPATIYCITFGDAVIRIVFGRGEFGANAIMLTSTAIAYYSLAFVFNGISAVLGRVFHSYMDTKTPMLAGLIAIVVNIILNIILVRSMAIAGLALATSIATALGALLKLVVIRRKLGPMGYSKLAARLLKTTLAAAALIGVCWAFKTYVAMPMTIKAFAALAASGVVYLLALIALRQEEVMEGLEWGLGLAKNTFR